MDVGEEETRESVVTAVAKEFCRESQEKWIRSLLRASSIVAEYVGDEAKFVAMSGILQFSMTEEEIKHVPLAEVIQKTLSKLNLLNKSDSDGNISPDPFWGLDSAEKAFEQPYESFGGEEAFMDHLAAQKRARRDHHYPFFCIIQSSGYGKSRLMKQLTTKQNDVMKVVYLSFASENAYPGPNVAFELKEYMGNDQVENAFVQLFVDALNTSETKFTLKKAIPDEYNNRISTDEVLFVLDEASQLLKKFATRDRDYFRCMRKATLQFSKICPNSFFVLVSTFSSVNRLMPGSYFDPSAKAFSGGEKEIFKAMEPFLLHDAIFLRNNRAGILAISVEDCHADEQLLAIGRPMWHALLQSRGSLSKIPTEKLLDFALSKLLQTQHIPQSSDLNSRQALALLACRACLTISPVSMFAPALVASHMATALAISTESDGVVAAYPSEPILALAAREFVKSHQKGDIARLLFCYLKEYFTSGAVEKGHRGEAIVRLLNLLAIDQCMEHLVAPPCVTEVNLNTFLSKFDRGEASLSHLLSNANSMTALSEKQQRVLKQLDALEVHQREPKDSGFPAEFLENGKVCFTHFVHLAENTMITPDLLRYAYRRTAAIVVNAGRRGIDWIIPVRLGSEDKFVGLAGQDKNRMRDTLSALSSLSCDATHHKMSAQYFLSQEELKLFEAAKWPLHWPAILFAVGSEEEGVAIAQKATRKRLRRNHHDTFNFPCIVLAGLGYNSLMTDGADRALRDLRDFVRDVPSKYKSAVPITYEESWADASDEMELR